LSDLKFQLKKSKENLRENIVACRRAVGSAEEPKYTLLEPVITLLELELMISRGTY